MTDRLSLVAAALNARHYRALLRHAVTPSCTILATSPELLFLGRAEDSLALSCNLQDVMQ